MGIFNKTVTIQIGNSDDKLTQKKWSQFVLELNYMVNNYCDVHFSGGSASIAEWQNYCIVGNVDNSNMDNLQLELREIGKAYNQESVSLTIGVTSYES